MLLSELKSRHKGHAEKLTIYSHEGGIYTLEVSVAGNMAPLQLESGKPAVHDSLNGIKERMSGVSVDEAFLVQAIPYDEMIGLASAQDLSRQKISWTC